MHSCGSGGLWLKCISGNCHLVFPEPLQPLGGDKHPPSQAPLNPDIMSFQAGSEPIAVQGPTGGTARSLADSVGRAITFVLWCHCWEVLISCNTAASLSQGQDAQVRPYRELLSGVAGGGSRHGAPGNGGGRSFVLARPPSALLRLFRGPKAAPGAAFRARGSAAASAQRVRPSDTDSLAAG